MLMKILKIFFYLPVYLVFPTRFLGKKNIPKGKVILVCNHQSRYDCFLLALSLWRKQNFLAKKELFSNKPRAAFLKGLSTIPIDRENTDLTAIKSCIKVLKKGEILTMFPEGTRNKTGEELQEIKNGAAMFALKTQSPIVPVWIKKKPCFFKPNSMRFGKPFTLEELYQQKINKETLDLAGEIIYNKIKENQF